MVALIELEPVSKEPLELAAINRLRFYMANRSALFGEPWRGSGECVCVVLRRWYFPRSMPMRLRSCSANSKVRPFGLGGTSSPRGALARMDWVKASTRSRAGRGVAWLGDCSVAPLHPRQACGSSRCCGRPRASLDDAEAKRLGKSGRESLQEKEPLIRSAVNAGIVSSFQMPAAIDTLNV